MKTKMTMHEGAFRTFYTRVVFEMHQDVFSNLGLLSQFLDLFCKVLINSEIRQSVNQSVTWISFALDLDFICIYW